MIVTSSFADLQTPTGPMRTYIHAPVAKVPPGQRFPGLVLYSEIFQQTEPVRRLAVQFASNGYVVMVPEVYHEHEPAGTVLGYDDVGKDKGNAYKAKTKLSTFDNDAKVVLKALTQHPLCNGRLGAVGICLGGHLAFRAAFNPEVLACCCFYPTDLQGGTLGEGGKADSLARARDIRGELFMAWGRQDPHIPYDGRLTIYKALHEAGVHFTWHEFNGEHAFLRDEGARYDASAARLGLTLALEVLGRVL